MPLSCPKLCLEKAGKPQTSTIGSESFRVRLLPLNRDGPGARCLKKISFKRSKVFGVEEWWCGECVCSTRWSPLEVHSRAMSIREKAISTAFAYFSSFPYQLLVSFSSGILMRQSKRHSIDKAIHHHTDIQRYENSWYIMDILVSKKLEEKYALMETWKIMAWGTRKIIDSKQICWRKRYFPVGSSFLSWHNVLP